MSYYDLFLNKIMTINLCLCFIFITIIRIYIILLIILNEGGIVDIAHAPDT